MDERNKLDTLEKRMDRIIEWVKTCDTKASILLSINAFVFTVLLASDFMMNGIKSVIVSVYNPEYTEASISGTIAVAAFALAVISLLASMLYCIWVLKAKTSENQTKKQGVKIDSLIHFHHISQLSSFAEFQTQMDSETDEVYKHDLYSQIFINAVRCQEKFDDYNTAVNWLIGAIPFALSYLIFIVFFLAQTPTV